MKITPKRTLQQLSAIYPLPMGLSLLESLITLALIAILATLAIPTYQRLTINQELRQFTVRIEHSFARMKSHALMKQKEVVFCGSGDFITCSQDWSDGFILFEDDNGNRRRDPEEEMLETYRPKTHSRRYTLTSCSRRYFRTSAAGPLASIAGRIIIKPPPPHAALTQQVIISRLGRTRLEKTAAQTGCSQT
jgi:Tfp pilus assembly protein FimT